MAERNRPGDDATGERPEDEVLPDVVEEDADEPVSGRGGTATRERQETSKKAVRRADVFGRIGGFVREVIAELRKVIWPTRNELLTYTAVVIVFLAFMTAIVAGLDYGFAKGLLWALGGGKK